MSIEIIEIFCQDGTDSRCPQAIEIEVDINDITENEDDVEYAERTGQDIICCYCGSDHDPRDYD